MDGSNASSNAPSSTTIRLTQHSKGGGCGCKIAPRALENILRQSYCNPATGLSEAQSTHEKQLLVGAETKDDAAAYDTGDGYAILTTTDFFMPIVDDPFTFGEIAAANAMSDVYAMGGTPLMAISILGWPLKKLPKEVAGQVIAGGRSMCKKAGIPLAGGHSIDTEEPIFGLAVTGRVAIPNLKRNSTAAPGNRLFLTKPLGIGLITTAEKRGKVKVKDADKAKDTMRQLNSVGSVFGELEDVTAMTDVTGFGLLGHLLEMCEGSGLRSVLYMPDVPLLPGVEEYFRAGCVPGGTQRNFESYGHKIATKNGEPLTDWQKTILCDPQTSGGLLVAIASEEAENKAHQLINQIHPAYQLYPIGYMERSLEPSEAVSVILDVTSAHR